MNRAHASAKVSQAQAEGHAPLVSGEPLYVFYHV